MGHNKIHPIKFVGKTTVQKIQPLHQKMDDSAHTGIACNVMTSPCHQENMCAQWGDAAVLYIGTIWSPLVRTVVFGRIDVSTPASCQVNRDRCKCSFCVGQTRQACQSVSTKLHWLQRVCVANWFACICTKEKKGRDSTGLGDSRIYALLQESSYIGAQKSTLPPAKNSTMGTYMGVVEDTFMLQPIIDQQPAPWHPIQAPTEVSVRTMMWYFRRRFVAVNRIRTYLRIGSKIVGCWYLGWQGIIRMTSFLYDNHTK